MSGRDTLFSVICQGNTYGNTHCTALHSAITNLPVFSLPFTSTVPFRCFLSSRARSESSDESLCSSRAHFHFIPSRDEEARGERREARGERREERRGGPRGREVRWNFEEAPSEKRRLVGRVGLEGLRLARSSTPGGPLADVVWAQWCASRRRAEYSLSPRVHQTYGILAVSPTATGYYCICSCICCSVFARTLRLLSSLAC